MSAESLPFEPSFPVPGSCGYGTITENECGSIQEKNNLIDCILLFRPEYSTFLPYVSFHFYIFSVIFRVNSHCTLAVAQAVAVDILHTQFPNYSISGTEKTSKGPLGQPNSLAELLLRRQSDATGLDHRVLGLAELLALLPRCVEGLREMLLSLKGPFPLKLCKH